MKGNERKILILQAIQKLGPSTAVDLWEASEDDISLNGVRMALLRYIRMGLLKRYGSPNPKKYDLTAKGVARLRWLKSMR